MKALTKLFYGINMSWIKVIVFAVVTGVATGLIMMAPLPDGCVLRNIGVTMESWIFFAMIVATNCKKPLEAAAKVFVFFLISQPLVYLTMWPVYQGFPWHYYRYWLMWTFISIPCGAAANYAARRGGVLGAIIIVLPCVLLAYQAADFLHRALGGNIDQFLAVLFCLATMVMYVLVLLKRPVERGVAGGLAAVALAVFVCMLVLAGPRFIAFYTLEQSGNYAASVADESIAEVQVENEDTLRVTAKGWGTTTVTLTGDDGTQLVYEISVDSKTDGIDINKLS